MNYYTSNIPLPLAEKLKEKGMPMQDAYTPILYDKPESVMSGCIIPTYAACFDWLMSEKNTNIYFDKDKGMWSVFIENENNPVPNCAYMQEYSTWHEVANAAIEKAITLI